MPPASELDFNAVSGTTYHIAVDGFNGAHGWITLDLLHVPATPLHFEGISCVITNAQIWCQFQLLGPANSTAVVQTTTNLNSADWMLVGTNLLTGSPLIMTIVNPATESRRFFRAYLVQ
jgi:hypothetical protein